MADAVMAHLTYSKNTMILFFDIWEENQPQSSSQMQTNHPAMFFDTFVHTNYIFRPSNVMDTFVVSVFGL